MAADIMMEAPDAIPPSPMDPEDMIYACKGCQQILEEGKAFELAGHRWHIDCFRCNTCGTLLDSDANLLLLGDGSLICNNCTYSCSACGNKIEDLAILTGDQAFCASCFRCRNCKRKIENLRYARTSQGIFCMNCHESLMARRRKKSRAAKEAAAKANHDRVLVDKSLPALPPSATVQTTFANSSDGETPFETPGTEPYSTAGFPDASPRPKASGRSRHEELKRDNSPASVDGHKNNRAMGLDGAADTLTLPASTYKENRRSHDSSRSEFSGTGNGDGDMFLQIGLDTTPAPGPSPLARSRQYDNGIRPTEIEAKKSERDYFTGRVPTTASHREMLRESEQDSRSSSQERRQKPGASPHIAYQERGRRPSSELTSSTQKRESPAPRTEQKRPTSPQPQRQLHSSRSNADFKLQDAPKSRKASSRKSSRTDLRSPSVGTPSLESPPLSVTSEALSPSPTASTITANDNRNRQDTASSATSIASHIVERPKREDSLPGPGSSMKNALARKEVAPNSAPATPATPTGFSHKRDNSTSSVLAVHGTPGRLSELNGGRTISTPTVSQLSRSMFDAPEPPLRSANRPGPPNPNATQDSFTQPRTAPAPPVSDLRQRGESVSTHSDMSGHPISPVVQFSPMGGLPRYNNTSELSMEEDMVRIMRGGDDSEGSSSVLRKVSNAVKHGRSFSDRGSRASSGHKTRGNLNGSMEISSPTMAASPGRETDPVLLQNQLRRSQQRIAELEAEKIGLQEIINSSADIKQVNTELQEKRSTMTFLDTQREMIVRELEIMTDHLKKAKDSNRPIDISSIQSVIVRDFAQSMERLKDTLSGQIEELMQKRNLLTSDISDLIQMKDKGFQELESLQKENKELIRMNAGLKQMAQQEAVRQANGSFDGGRPNGLGIYTRSKELSMDGKTLTATESPMSNFMNEDGHEANMLAAPQVVNIRKAKPNMWKKGGNALVKNVKGAFAKANQFPDRSGYEHGGVQGMAYGTSQPGREPAFEISHPTNVTKVGGAQVWGNQRPGLKPGSMGKLANQSTTDLVGAEPAVLFGSDLSARVTFEKARIPRIVQKCIQEVQLRGMTVEGIYRKSGGSGQVNSVREGFQKDIEYDISDEDLDIHAITSALKQYFRRLPNPLITYEVYDQLLEAGQVQDLEKRAIQMRDAINELPTAHYDCLEFLVFHLTKVMDKQAVNLMTPLNLAVVFAPTIMRPQSIEREMSDMQGQRMAVQSLLEHSKTIFDKDAE